MGQKRVGKKKKRVKTQDLKHINQEANVQHQTARFVKFCRLANSYLAQTAVLRIHMCDLAMSLWDGTSRPGGKWGIQPITLAGHL